MIEPSEPRLKGPNVEFSQGMAEDSTARLSDAIARATLKYSIKDYSSAAELYSQATELQAELNGEMSPQNADLLYAYGRCLYHVAVPKSDVLGSKIATGKREEKRADTWSKKQQMEKVDRIEGTISSVDKVTIPQAVGEAEPIIDDGEENGNESKPYFNFTGDENFDNPDDEDDGPEDEDDGVAEEDDDDDDFVNAYEVLDLARVLLLKRLNEVVGEESGRVKDDAQTAKLLKERLADTFDLQAEISLEGERFPDAVVDLRSALALKDELFPQESSLIAEAHYKLSLALEFSSVTQQRHKDEDAGVEGEALVDEAMREEAAKEMEAAIASCKLRTQQEDARAAADDPEICDKEKISRENIDEVKGMIKEMEQRVLSITLTLLELLIMPQLIELRQPPISINDPTNTGNVHSSADPLRGILGSIVGESPATQRARMEEASKDANDLTMLVKRKKPTNGASIEAFKSGPDISMGKRKVGISDNREDAGTVKKFKSTRE